MIAQFFDRQDPHNPHNEQTITDFATLLSWLAEARGRPPFFCELLGDNGYKLLLGMSDELGCAQYSARDGSPPYMMATAHDAEPDDNYIVFLIADTDTPVPRKFCLPMTSIREVLFDFTTTGNRSTRVAWEEI